MALSNSSCKIGKSKKRRIRRQTRKRRENAVWLSTYTSADYNCSNATSQELNDPVSLCYQHPELDSQLGQSDIEAFYYETKDTTSSMLNLSKTLTDSHYACGPTLLRMSCTRCFILVALEDWEGVFLHAMAASITQRTTSTAI